MGIPDLTPSADEIILDHAGFCGPFSSFSLHGFPLSSRWIIVDVASSGDFYAKLIYKIDKKGRKYCDLFFS